MDSKGQIDSKNNGMELIENPYDLIANKIEAALIRKSENETFIPVRKQFPTYRIIGFFLRLVG